MYPIGIVSLYSVAYNCITVPSCRRLLAQTVRCEASRLRSSRSSKRKRHLRHAEVLFEGHARNMRGYMGVKGLRPHAIAAQRRQEAQENKAQETAPAKKK